MSFAGLRDIVRDYNYAIHGVPAVVQPPDGFPGAATVIWLTPATADDPPGGDIRRADARRALAFRTSEVPSYPRGTKFTVAESPGDDAADFLLDSVEKIEEGEARVLVVRRL